MHKNTLISRARPFTMIDSERLNALYDMAESIDANAINGDIVECGTANGGSAAIIGHRISSITCGRRLWLFDSFQGLPLPGPEDGAAAIRKAGTCCGSVSIVTKALLMTGIELANVKFVPGWFEETLADADIDRIALLHIDADWYASVKLSLNRFYDLVSPGGYIVFDDYGHWPGCKQAVDEFIRERGIQNTLTFTGVSSCWMLKS